MPGSAAPTARASSSSVSSTRINWHTVGSILAPVEAERDRQDDDRLAGVTRIGIDEVSFAKGQRYLTVVVDHDSGRLLHVAEGRSKKTVHAFFDLLGAARSRALAHVSADGGRRAWPTSLPLAGGAWVFCCAAQVLSRRLKNER
ncbi:transposase [Kitasatospora sp. NPDC087314]|uniref:transposase n=1 Tax=Kitasatospora sp. NPDC087314 TaxID=3364068 RepID=UPI0037FBD1C5